MNFSFSHIFFIIRIIISMSYYKYSSVLEKFRLYRNTNKIRKEKKIKFAGPGGAERSCWKSDWFQRHSRSLGRKRHCSLRLTKASSRRTQLQEDRKKVSIWPKRKPLGSIVLSTGLEFQASRCPSGWELLQNYATFLGTERGPSSCAPWLVQQSYKCFSSAPPGKV